MEKNFENALISAKATADVLAAIVNEIKLDLDYAQPERVGEMLSKAVEMAGSAQLLLIDINDMIKSA